MSTPIEEVVEKLRASTANLNKASDDLAAIVREVEVFLESCNVGVDAFVKVLDVPNTEDGPGHSVWLQYCRVGANFRIAVVWNFDAEHETIKPWSDCSRREKLSTIIKLPALLEAITEKVEANTENVRKVTSRLVSELKPILKSGKAGK